MVLPPGKVLKASHLQASRLRRGVGYRHQNKPPLPIKFSIKYITYSIV